MEFCIFIHQQHKRFMEVRSLVCNRSCLDSRCDMRFFFPQGHQDSAQGMELSFLFFLLLLVVEKPGGTFAWKQTISMQMKFSELDIGEMEMVSVSERLKAEGRGLNVACTVVSLFLARQRRSQLIIQSINQKRSVSLLLLCPLVYFHTVC